MKMETVTKSDITEKKTGRVSRDVFIKGGHIGSIKYLTKIMGEYHYSAVNMDGEVWRFKSATATKARESAKAWIVSTWVVNNY
jgi:hypothetical protein